MNENLTSIEELHKALESLKVAIALLNQSFKNEPSNTDLHKALRDSCIQRFEFCVELSWKTSIRVLGLQIKSPNTAIREMARNNLIDDTQIWFDLLVARNKTSHTYDEDVAKEVLAITINSLPLFEDLYQKLKEHQK